MVLQTLLVSTARLKFMVYGSPTNTKIFPDNLMGAPALLGLRGETEARLTLGYV